MSELRPTDAWGDVLYSDMTEEQATWYEDGYDAGFDDGYKNGLVDAAGAVTALFVAEVDDDVEDLA